MRRALAVLSIAIVACGAPAATPGAGSAPAGASVSAEPRAPTPFVGHYPADCEHWPYDEELKAELTQKAIDFLGGLQGARSRSWLEQVHPAGLFMVQPLLDSQTDKPETRETLVPRAHLLRHLAEGGGAWLLDGFSEPIRVLRQVRVGAHWDVTDGSRRLCLAVPSTEGMFDEKPYVVVDTTAKERDEGFAAPVVVLFAKDDRGAWLVAAVVRPWQVLE